MNTIKIIKVKDDQMCRLKIHRKIIVSKAGAFFVTLVKQKYTGLLNDGTPFCLDIDKREVWFPPNGSYIDKEFSSSPEIVIMGKYLNPLLKTIQLNNLRNENRKTT
jgi:hypothetical protein